MQWVVKYSSILSYMLEPPSLLTQGFNKNKKAQENLFNDMCNFGARAEWSNGRRDASSYLDVDISNGQYRLVNLTPLECIAGSTMEDAIDDRYLKRMHQRRLNIIDGSISSYCSILNSLERLHMINQANELSLIHSPPLDQISKIKICHMVVSEHPEVTEVRRRLISTDVLDSEEAYEYVSIDNDVADLDE